MISVAQALYARRELLIFETSENLFKHTRRQVNLSRCSLTGMIGLIITQNFLRWRRLYSVIRPKKVRNTLVSAKRILAWTGF